jgi:hypothetical protein
MGATIYQLQLKGGKCEKLNGQSFVKSHYHSTPAKYVIYVMRKSGTIFYVGQAGRGLLRCLDGLTAKSTQSVAYKWRTDKNIKNSKVEILVVYGFLGSSLANKRSAREIVEADVAASIFTETGVWPSKLRQLTVRGNVARNSSYRHALNSVLEELRDKSWL